MGRIELHGHGKDSFGIAILKSGIKSLGFKNKLREAQHGSILEEFFFFKKKKCKKKTIKTYLYSMFVFIREKVFSGR